MGRLFAAALVVSLLIQMHIAADGYASRRTKIAFTSNRDGNSEIYVMDGDGGNQRRVTVNPRGDLRPAWSPDGKKIAFVSNRRNKDHLQIWVIDADGKNPIRLTDGLWDDYPDWSPDGTKIVYDAHLHPEEHDVAPAGITVMDADGNNKRLLTREGAHPSWSPDGKRIAFVSSKNPGDDAQIYVMDVDGRNRMQLTHDFVHKRLPAWSPDGLSIAYVDNNGIWVVDSDGGNQRQLTKINGDAQPTWSPQSDAIAFHSFERDRVSGIYVVDVTNGDVNALQHDPEFWNSAPDWLYPGELSVSPQRIRITMWGRLKKVVSSLR